jgi:hypothetical protein
VHSVTLLYHGLSKADVLLSAYWRKLSSETLRTGMQGVPWQMQQQHMQMQMQQQYGMAPMYQQRYGQQQQQHYMQHPGQVQMQASTLFES